MGGDVLGRETLHVQKAQCSREVALDPFDRERGLAEVVIDEQNQVLDIVIALMALRRSARLEGTVHEPIAGPAAPAARASVARGRDRGRCSSDRRSLRGVVRSRGCIRVRGSKSGVHMHRVARPLPHPQEIDEISVAAVIPPARTGPPRSVGATRRSCGCQRHLRPMPRSRRARGAPVMHNPWRRSWSSAPSRMIPDEKLQELRERVAIDEIVGRYVTLRPSGARQFKGLCPFHGEKTPSFYVDVQRKSFKCFGCGEYGDAIKFVEKIEGISFLEAVYRLGEATGIELTRGRRSVAASDPAQREREEGARLNQLAMQHWQHILVSEKVGEAGREYLSDRGISSEIAASFRLGYAPAPTEAGWDSLYEHLKRSGGSIELAEALGLVAKSERTSSFYDRFRGRLMFPIARPGGTIIGFSGRILPAHIESSGDPPPKYMNSPESALYQKSRSLYGLDLAGPMIRRRRRTILVEGNVDVVRMHARGFEECVAPLGTALTADQCKQLARFCDTVVLCFDGDRAGAKAMRDALGILLAEGLEVRVVQLEDGEDPDSADPTRLANLLEAPQPGIRWLLQRMVNAGALESFESRSAALRGLVGLLRHIKDDLARDDYIGLAARMLELPAGRIREALRQAQVSGRGPDAGTNATARRSASAPPSPSRRDERTRPRDAAAADQQRARPSAPPRRETSPHVDVEGLEVAMDPDDGEPPNWDTLAPSQGGRPAEGNRPTQGVSAAARPAAPATADRGHGADRDEAQRRTDTRHGRATPRDVPAGAGRAGVSHSSATDPTAPLPPGQAAIVALLVDLPHLASAAREVDVLEHIRDSRLHPIAARILDGAARGDLEEAGLGELLELVPVAAQRLINDEIFSGRYGNVDDPERSLAEGLAQCRIEELEQEIAVSDRDFARAMARGDAELARALQRAKIEMRREQANYREALATGRDLPQPSAPARSPERVPSSDSESPLDSDL